MPLALQIHGFASDKHPAYPQVVLGGSGEISQGAVGDLLNNLGKALREAGLTVGVCDGTHWRDLCGETNTQAMSMNNGVFVHLELDESVRSDYQNLVAALTRSLEEYQSNEFP